VVDVNAALQHDNEALPTNLTHSSGVCPAEYENLSWSPAGDRLAYSSACEGVTIDVYVMTLQETENGLIPTDEKNLTHSDVRDGLYGLDWSPDGTSLVFVSLLDFAPTTDMVVANVDRSIAEGKAIVGFKLLDGAQSGYIYYYPTWAPRRCSD
jgi:Tol biopolymer transport system component